MIRNRFNARRTSYRLVAIGDSTVSGSGAGTDGGIYDHIPLGGRVTVVHKGIAGQTSSDVLARMTTDVYAFTPRYCTISVGTNDGLNSIASATANSNLDSIISGCVSNGIVPLIMGIHPIWGFTQTQAKEDICLAVDAHLQAAGHAYFNARALSGDGATPPAIKAAYNSGDGLHPNATGYRAFGSAVFSQWFAGKPA